MKQKRKILAAVMIVALSVCMMSGLNWNSKVQAADAWGEEYSIENILTDYNLFAEGNLKAKSHTVGAVACGGEGEMAIFGDGATDYSYFGKGLKSGQFASSNWVGSEYDSLRGVKEGSDAYIDIAAAFSALRKESNALAATGHVVNSDDLKNASHGGYKILVLDFSKYDNFVIPSDMYDQCTHISLNNLTPEMICSKKHVISIAGAAKVNMNFGYNSDPAKKGILYNAVADVNNTFNNSNSLKSMLSTEHGGQMKTDGMKLIWNIPAATEVTVVDDCAGHIVAPNAAFVSSSIYEGGVIAKSIQTGDEGHFFPYNKISPKKSGASAAPGSTPSAKPSVAPGSTPSAKPSAAPGSTPSAAPGSTPSAKPSAAPGSTPSAKPSATPGAVPSSTPQNVTTNSQDTKKANLVIVVKDKNTDEVVPNAEVTVTYSDGTVKKCVTDETGTITLNDVPEGVAKCVVTQVPKGYSVDTNEKFEMTAVAGQTTKEVVRINNKTAEESTGDEDSEQEEESEEEDESTADTESEKTMTGEDQPETGDWYQQSIGYGLIVFSVLGLTFFFGLRKRQEDK